MQKQRKRDPPGSAREAPLGLLKCVFYPNNKYFQKGIKMKPLKRAQDLPQNHLHVFQKAASREYPKTRPKRVLRDAPTGPFLKTSLFHWTVCKLLKTGSPKGGPRRQNATSFGSEKQMEATATPRKRHFQKHHVSQMYLNYFLNTLGNERGALWRRSAPEMGPQAKMLLPSRKYNVFQRVHIQAPNKKKNVTKRVSRFYT